jgi:antitoxin (DNA-binding transcriptional repressor) of toxin-antitoxin stability system
MAKLSPLSKALTDRIPGLDKGAIQIPEDFDAPLPEDLQELFES